MEVRRSSGEHGVMKAKTSHRESLESCGDRPRPLQAAMPEQQSLPQQNGLPGPSPPAPRRRRARRRRARVEGVALRTRFTPRRPRTSAPLGIAPIGRPLFGGSHRNVLFRSFREFDIFYLGRQTG